MSHVSIIPAVIDHDRSWIWIRLGLGLGYDHDSYISTSFLNDQIRSGSGTWIICDDIDWTRTQLAKSSVALTLWHVGGFFFLDQNRFFFINVFRYGSKSKVQWVLPYKRHLAVPRKSGYVVVVHGFCCKMSFFIISNGITRVVTQRRTRIRESRTHVRLIATIIRSSRLFFVLLKFPTYKYSGKYSLIAGSAWGFGFKSQQGNGLERVAFFSFFPQGVSVSELHSPLVKVDRDTVDEDPSPSQKIILFLWSVPLDAYVARICIKIWTKSDRNLCRVPRMCVQVPCSAVNYTYSSSVLEVKSQLCMGWGFYFPT